MHVIGSVSSEEKAKYVVEQLGADECFNYTKEPCADALKRLAPDGLDVVYENVGGDHFQAAVDNMKWFGRIIVCGMVRNFPHIYSATYLVSCADTSVGLAVQQEAGGEVWCHQPRRHFPQTYPNPGLYLLGS